MKKRLSLQSIVKLRKTLAMLLFYLINNQKRCQRGVAQGQKKDRRSESKRWYHQRKVAQGQKKDRKSKSKGWYRQSKVAKDQKKEMKSKMKGFQVVG